MDDIVNRAVLYSVDRLFVGCISERRKICVVIRYYML